MNWQDIPSKNVKKSCNIRSKNVIFNIKLAIYERILYLCHQKTGKQT